MFSKLQYRIVLPLMLCGTVISGCATSNDAPLGSGGERIEITGGVVDLNAAPQAPMPIVSNDPSVKVFPLDGPAENPLSVSQYNSVLDNTTAGGYTVFDESVKVFPLPGEDVPAFVPAYAVPPLKSQYKPDTPMVGERLTSLSESSLPPLPTVDVGEAEPFASPPISGAVRQPLTLTAPEPMGMQPPTSARAPLTSPFEEDDMADVRAPVLTEDAPAPVEGGTIATGSGVTAAGRKSSPMLTGY